MADDYIKLLHLEKYPNLLAHFDIKYSQYFRVSHTNAQLLNGVAIKKINNTTCVFKVKNQKTACVYSYLYSSASGAAYSTLEDWYKIATPYAVCSSTFKSQDGEYRYRLNRMKHFEKMSKKYSEICDIVESAILKKMESGKLSLYIEFCKPFMGAEVDASLEGILINERIALKLFVICWICDFYLIRFNISQNHMYATYREIILNPDDLPLHDKLIEMIGGRDEYEKMIDEFSQFQVKNPKPEQQYPMFGQKVFALTYKEAINREDIRYGVWRELYLARICSDIVLNGITPCFPLVGNWFYIENSTREIFDNQSMLDRFRASDLGGAMERELYDVDIGAYLERNKKNGVVNQQFSVVSAKINSAIEFLDTYINITNLSVGFTMEHLGRTIKDMPNIALNNELEKPKYIETFNKDPETYIGNLFEYVYTLAIVNERFKLIHGDLHANNATIFEYYKNPPKNMYRVYIHKGRLFKFKYGNLVSGIIDFSRGIIGDIDTIVEKRGEVFAQKLVEDQSMRIIRAFVNFFPKFYADNKEAIDRLITKNFKLVFKIMTIIDTYSLFKAMHVLFVSDVIFTEKLGVSPRISNMVKNIYVYSENLFISLLNKAINGSIVSHEEFDYPNNTILVDNFDGFTTFDERIKDTVGEIFNGDNILQVKFEEIINNVEIDNIIEKNIEKRTGANDVIRETVAFW